MIGGALAGLLVLITFSVSAFMIPVAAEPASSLHHSASFLHHDVKIRIDPSRGAIKVVDRITIDGAKVKALRLAPWLTFSRLEIDGAAVPLARADSVLRLPQTPVDPREIIVSYAGKPPATGDDHGARSAPGGAIGSQGTFLPGGAGWLPHLDTGPGAATYRLHVAVPGNQVAVATGRLVEEHTDPDGYEAVFVAERPGEEPSLFAGPYTVRERRHGWIRLRTYFHAEDGELAKAYLDAAAGYLDAFSARIGAYPFEGLAIVSSPFPVGLGFPGVT